MFIHTIIYNESYDRDKIIQEFKKLNQFELILWDYSSILEFIKDKYPEYLNYFKRLILNKSRENFSKYLIVYNFGGLFINLNMLTNHLNELDELYNCSYKNICKDMIFFYENKQCDLTQDIFDISDKVISDDIFIVRNKSNSFINYLVSNIDMKLIPVNEYENKINLGNIFLTKQLEQFYLDKINVRIGNNYWFNNITQRLTNQIDLKYEQSIYKIIITTNIFSKNQNEYKLLTYPNVPDLSEPESFFENWDFLIKIKNYIENFFIILLYQYSRSWAIIFCVIIIMICINILIKKFFIELVDVHHPNASVDSKVLFDWKKFKIFRELKKHWVDIKSEAIQVMNMAPKLDLAIEDWHASNPSNSSNPSNGVNNTIYNQAGWIKYWKYSPDDTLDDKAKNKQTGNPEWLNFGFYHFGNEFVENLKLCPKTVEILNNFKSQINICGFSWMMGNCLLYPHNDVSGLNSGSLVLHLGLVVPIPSDTCKLVIKNDFEQYVQITENEGKIFVFDSTYEHYAYNQSNQSRIILYIDFNLEK